MSDDKIRWLLDTYGLSFLLEQERMNEIDVMNILDELGYINLERLYKESKSYAD